MISSDDYMFIYCSIPFKQIASKCIRFFYELKGYELTAAERQNRKVNVRYSADYLI